MHPLTQLKPPKGHVAVYWFGQSSLAFRSPGGATLLADPFFPRERPRDKFIHGVAPLRESDLPVDGVLLTHDHSDHTNPETLGRIREAFPKAVFVGPPEIPKRLAAHGVKAEPFVLANAGTRWTCKDLMAHFVFSKPPRGDPKAGIQPPDVTHLGFVLDCEGPRLYVTGDLIRTFADLPELLQAVKALKPDVGFLTCHPTEGEFPLFDGCVKVAQRLGLKQAIPQHYDCFVKRTYDPREWARGFWGTGIQPRVVGYNQMVLVP